MLYLPASGRRNPRFEVWIVWAFMAFPGDEAERNGFIARFYEWYLVQLEGLMKAEPSLQGYPVSRMIGDYFGRVLEPLGGFSVLGQIPGYEAMDERFGKSFWPGAIAGDLLLSMLQLRAA